ncbi:MAG: hypothetical protein EOL93_06745 [Epsilonproteobacteria bacterium]|nr:hypothetical protein [Campylobacterota bacterium]
MKTIENYKFRDMILRIGITAVKEAQARSLVNGVPNVFSRDGVPYFQMPSGEITSKIPKEYESVYN